METDAEIEEIRAKRLEARINAPELKVVEGPIRLTDDSFDRAVKENEIMVVDFWAGWCMPCKMLAPTLEDIAAKYAGRAVVGKLDVDENPKMAMRFGIASIPTLMFFKNGEPVNKVIGVVPRASIERVLDNMIDG